MPAGHVISLTLGQSQWQPSQWKQRDASLQAVVLGSTLGQNTILFCSSGFLFTYLVAVSVSN